MLPDCQLAPAVPSLAFFTFALKDRSFQTRQLQFNPARRCSDHTQSPKRCRATSDVDSEGSGCFQKKKRRLRLDLITSRLSLPYATPATYVVACGSSRIAKWARRRTAGPGMLRKAAIINSARLRRTRRSGTPSGRRSRPRSIERARQSTVDVKDAGRSTKNSAISPDRRTQQISSTPSPLGLSNYDALDLEGDPYDDDGLYDADENLINSDFNKREPVEIPPVELELPPFPRSKSASMPQMPSSKYIMGLIDSEEVQKEISFAQFDSVPASHSVNIEPLYFF